MRFSLLTLVVLVTFGASCDAGDVFSSTAGTCEPGDAPRLPFGSYSSLDEARFEARARSVDLSGTATSETGTSYWDGERNVSIGILRLNDGRSWISIKAPELLDPSPRDRFDVSVSYNEGGGTAYTGGGEFRVEAVENGMVRGIFSGCSTRYPMGALFREKALMKGGVRVAVPTG